jgi:hypothetical protein
MKIMPVGVFFRVDNISLVPSQRDSLRGHGWLRFCVGRRGEWTREVEPLTERERSPARFCGKMVMPSCFRFLVKWSRCTPWLGVPKLILGGPLLVIIWLNVAPFYIK